MPECLSGPPLGSCGTNLFELSRLLCVFLHTCTHSMYFICVSFPVLAHTCIAVHFNLGLPQCLSAVIQPLSSVVRQKLSVGSSYRFVTFICTVSLQRRVCVSAVNKQTHTHKHFSRCRSPCSDAILPVVVSFSLWLCHSHTSLVRLYLTR